MFLARAMQVNAAKKIRKKTSSMKPNSNVSVWFKAIVLRKNFAPRITHLTNSTRLFAKNEIIKREKNKISIRRTKRSALFSRLNWLREPSSTDSGRIQIQKRFKSKEPHSKSYKHAVYWKQTLNRKNDTHKNESSFGLGPTEVKLLSHWILGARYKVIQRQGMFIRH